MGETAYKINHPHYGEFTVTNIDTLYRHKDNRFDHLRYHHPAEAEQYGAMIIRCLFIGEESIEYLANEGIAEAYLDEPTATTRALYEADFLRWADFEASDD